MFTNLLRHFKTPQRHGYKFLIGGVAAPELSSRLISALIPEYRYFITVVRFMLKLAFLKACQCCGK